MTESVVDAAAVNLDGIKTLLGNGLITFFIKDNPGFSNGQDVYQEVVMIVPL